ncbi:MAG: nicotinate-nucleotide--dimethylbenzimidazole phosphoribosyltransferase, partial [Rhodospirillales bacterium]|nr:nicotinate-nucleotide--dimethylbenzimidazole phosphoribosyltransferase [Rhodospirillales bacterium]
MKTPQTIDALRDLISDLPRADAAAEAAARDRDAQLTKPAGSLGRLEGIAAFMAAWQRRNPPRCESVKTLVFAGNHGVTAQGVSAFPAEVTVQMVANFAAGTAAINQICKAVGAELEVCALDLDKPTADFTEAPAMSAPEFLAAFALGMEKVPDDIDLLCVGEMGIGNTTAAAAICRGLYGGAGADWAGPGTGVDRAGVDRKAQAIESAMARHGG